MIDESELLPKPLPAPPRRPRFPLLRACAISSIPGVIAAAVVIWMAIHHHAHLRLPLVTGLADWIYWPVATLAWFLLVSGIPLAVSFLLWVASHLTPQP